MTMDLGLVVAIHPEDNSVDLVMVEDGSRLAGVQCLAAPGASIRSGQVNLVAPGDPDAGDKWSLTGKRGFETLATVDYVGRGRMPVVTGFLFPQVCQMLFDRLNFHVDRHPSDWYQTVDDAGNVEWSHPSGSFVRMAESPEHENLTALDFDKKWAIDRNTARAPWLSILVANAGSEVFRLRVDPSGNVTVVHTGNLSVETAGNAAVAVAGNAAVTVDGTTSITSGGAMSITAPTLAIAANIATTGTLTNNGKNVGSNHQHLNSGGPSVGGVPQ